jgi:hypothetical protein
MKAPLAKQAQPEAQAVARPPPTHVRRRRRRAKPPVVAAAPPKPTEREAPGYRQSVAEAVAGMRAAFASRTDQQYWRGAKFLESISDERIADLQTEWRAQTGADLYPYLLAHTRESSAPGLGHAIDLLRKAFARNPPLQRAFMPVYAAPDIVDTYARQIAQCFYPFMSTNPREGDGVVLLREQPPSVREKIDAAFRARYDKGIVEWMIGFVPRSQNMVRAVALMRGGDGSDQPPWMELALILIPPENRNDKLPVAILRGLKLAERRKNEAEFNRHFWGVGKLPGKSQPDTLRGHLVKTAGIWSKAEFHEALALLHHEELSDAEKLYLFLPAWASTDNDSAVALMEQIAEKGTSRQSLEYDWARYVTGGMEHTITPFTDLSIPDYIKSMFRRTRSNAEQRLLQQFYSLRTDGDRERVTKLEPTPGWDGKAEEDAAAAKLEDARVRSAIATVAALRGRAFGDDKAIVEALRKMNLALQARIDRLDRRIEEARSDETLTPVERRRLIDAYLDAAQAAQRAAEQTRRQWTEAVMDGTLDLSGSDRDLARVLLSNDISPADEVYVAAMSHEDDALVGIVTRTWAMRGIDQMHRDAAKANRDALGNPARPRFELSMLIGTRHGTVPYQRVMTLAAGGLSDAKRGVARLNVELTQGKSDTDLAGVVSFLSTPHLDKALRDEVVKIYVDWLRDEGIVDPVSGDPPAKQFLEHIRLGLYGDKTEAGDGEATNYMKLSKLLLPPATVAERVEYAGKLRKAGRRGKLSRLTGWAADAWDVVSGNYLGEAEDRSKDRLAFINNASNAELQPLLELTGMKDRDALAAHELESFESRHGERQAVENSCAQLIAGMVEVLVEAGLSPLTGGAGLLAVVDSMAASIASMVASEALLGPNYKLISAENLNSVIQSGLGSAMVELDLRAVIVGKLPLKELEKHGGLAVYLQQGTHNVLTGLAEGSVLSGAEIVANLLSTDKWPSDEELAKHADQIIGRLIAKVHSTPFTVNYNPGNYHPYMAFAERLKQNVIFKLALKVTESGAKELVSQAFSSARDSTFADRFLALAWKEARSTVSAVTKGATSAVGQAGTAVGEMALIEQTRRENPAAFTIILREAISERYKDPVKGAKLRDEHARAIATGHKMSEHEFVLSKMAQADKQGSTEIAELNSKIHKAVYENCSLLSGQTATKGVLAHLEQSRPLGAIAADEAEMLRKARPPQDPARDMKIAEAAIGRYAGKIADPHSDLSGKVRAMMLARARDHAAEEPEHFGTRIVLVAEVLYGETPLAHGVRRGHPEAIREFIRRHGDWKQAIEMFEAAGPHLAYVASAMMKQRGELVEYLAQRFGVRLDKNASKEPISDVDLSTEGDDAGAKMLAAEEYMLHTYGERWRQQWNANFYVDAGRSTRYMDVLHQMSPDQRARTQVELTCAAELYSFARMIQATRGHAELERMVEKTAEGVGYRLDDARALVARTTKETAEARRRELALDVDEKVRLYNAKGPDGAQAVSGEARQNLAVEISRMQMEQNFYTIEANIGGGADRSVLGRVNVTGLEAYQAVLSNHAAYFEHRAQPGSLTTYNLGKYLSRTASDMRVSGVDHTALHPYEEQGRILYKRHRHWHRPGGSFASRQAPPPSSPQELSAHYTGFEQTVIPVMRQLRALAFANPDLHQPSPRPEAGKEYRTPKLGPVPHRAGAAGEIVVRVLSSQEAGPRRVEPRVVVAPPDPLRAPPLPPRFGTEAAFDKAMGWDAPPRRFTRDHAEAVLGLTVELAIARRDHYRALADNNPHDIRAAHRAEVMALLVDEMLAGPDTQR